jgi:hypothetical protein
VEVLGSPHIPRESFSMLNRVFALGLLALPLLGQIGGTGSIQGTVADPSGAMIPGASVTAINVGTQVRVARQTTAAGLFVLSPLAPGEYSVAVSAGGFQPLQQDKVMVDALGTVSLQLTLKVGSASDAVTITDTPPPVNTSDARVGQTIRNEVYTALPLAMSNAPRDPTAFIQYMPGVVPGGQQCRRAGVRGAGEFAGRVCGGAADYEFGGAGRGAEFRVGRVGGSR